MFSWHAIPFARILLPYMLGILFAFHFNTGYTLPACLFVCLLLIFTALHFKKNTELKFRTTVLAGITITILLIVLGSLRTFCFNEIHQPNYFAKIPSQKYLKVTIDDGIVEKTKYYRCYASCTSILDSGNIEHGAQGTLLLYLKKARSVSKPIIGNQYLIKANITEIKEPANPEEFNYKKYLSYHNINFQLFADSSKIIQLQESKNSIYRFAYQLRNQSLVVLKRYIDSPQELGVAEALLLGYKDDLDPDITAAFSRTGTLHVLAVSGLHAGIIYLILAFFTKPLTKKKYGKILQVVILLSGIWLYAFVTGLSSSVLRASIMFSFISVGRLLKYHVNIYNNIFSSAFILLLYNPLFIFDVGFQLSYLAVLGIVFVQPMIAKWYLPRFWIDQYVWGLISVSLAAQLLTFPISIYYFHQFPNYFLLSNLLIIPITSMVLIGLIALLALHFIPFSGFFIGKAVLYILKFNNWLVQGIDNLPNAYTNGLHFNLLQLLLMYAILLVFLAFSIHRYKYMLYTLVGLIFMNSVCFAILRYYQNKQRILVIHTIKGHDVFTCIDGRHATIIADSAFLENESAIKFFIEPYFWTKGINSISTQNFQKSFLTTNILNIENVGFQFYDRILTIDKDLPEPVYKKGIILLKNYKFNYFKTFSEAPKTMIISAIINNSKRNGFKKQYFKYYKRKLKETESFILISF